MRLILISLLALSSTTFASVVKCFNEELNQSIEIKSACQLPTGRDGVRTRVNNQSDSVIKIFKNNQLTSTQTANCAGIFIEDEILYSMTFKNSEISMIYTVMDDYADGAYDHWLEVDDTIFQCQL